MLGQVRTPNSVILLFRPLLLPETQDGMKVIHFHREGRLWVIGMRKTKAPQEMLRMLRIMPQNNL